VRVSSPACFLDSFSAQRWCSAPVQPAIEFRFPFRFAACVSGPRSMLRFSSLLVFLIFLLGQQSRALSPLLCSGLSLPLRILPPKDLSVVAAFDCVRSGSSICAVLHLSRGSEPGQLALLSRVMAAICLCGR
jgi:hypothetical protein